MPGMQIPKLPAFNDARLEITKQIIAVVLATWRDKGAGHKKADVLRL